MNTVYVSIGPQRFIDTLHKLNSTISDIYSPNFLPLVADIKSQQL